MGFLHYFDRKKGIGPDHKIVPIANFMNKDETSDEQKESSAIEKGLVTYADLTYKDIFDFIVKQLKSLDEYSEVDEFEDCIIDSVDLILQKYQCNDLGIDHRVYCSYKPNYRKFMRNLLQAVFDCCAIYGIDFEEAFDDMEEVPVCVRDNSDCKEEYFFYPYSFADFSSLVENSRVIPSYISKDSYVRRIDGIFLEHFNMFIQCSDKEDIDALYDFNGKYGSIILGDYEYQISHFLKGSRNYILCETACEIGAKFPNMLVSAFMFCLTNLVDYMFLVRVDSNAVQEQYFNSEIISIIQKIKEHKSEDFSEQLFEEWDDLLRWILEECSGKVMNAFIDLLLSITDVSEQEITEKIETCVNDVFLCSESSNNKRISPQTYERLYELLENPIAKKEISKHNPTLITALE